MGGPDEAKGSEMKKKNPKREMKSLPLSPDETGRLRGWGKEVFDIRRKKN